MTTRFFFRVGNIGHIGTDPRTVRVLSSIPGWDDLLASYENANRPFEAPAPYDEAVAVEAFLAGGDLTEITREAATQKRHYDDFTATASSIQRRAKAEHDMKVRRFIDTHQAEIRAGVLDAYNEIKTKAKALLPDLGRARTIQQAISNPRAAAAFAELDQLAKELGFWGAVLGQLTQFDTRNQRWPHFGLLADYPTAWPRFHRYMDYRERDDRNNNTLTLSAEREPWADAFDLLIDIVERDLALWAPSRTEYEQAWKDAEAKAQYLQAEEIRAAKQGRTIDISPAQSAYKKVGV